tara:strand:+ start:767668 stop:768924 length:1257 start_codon:yes stop_codon:yes gene_type:complete
MSKIKIYDAIMGSGKTHDAIERMKSYLNEERKFIYITPFKTEIQRILDALNSEEVFAPLDMEDFGSGSFEITTDLILDDGSIDLNAEPTFKYLNKRAQFLKMASQGKNIISTHALFLGLNKSDFQQFKDYILILDEVVMPIEVLNIGAQDIEILRNQDLIVINDVTNEVNFINDDYSDPAFRQIKNLCSRSSVYFLDRYFFVWVFPIEIFKEFIEVQILTYLFEGSLLAAYFRLYDIHYELLYKEDSSQLKHIKEHLRIYEGRSNSICGRNSFSKTWVDNLDKRNSNKIKDATSYVFGKVFGTKSNENAFTTFKNSRSKLAGGGYSKGFIPINARASNTYRHKESMAYLGNRYFNPQYISFFREKDIHLNEDLWALSELIQWIWRGCIRDGKQMNVFIPSKRMRSLLKDWLDGKYNRE